MPLSKSSSTQLSRLSRRVVAGLAGAALLAGCGGGIQPAGNVVAGSAPAEAAMIEAGDNFFRPDQLTLDAGDEVTVEIENTGTRPHDWTVDELTLSTGIIAPGEVFHATFTVPDTDVEFVCTLHGGMDGTIRVS